MSTERQRTGGQSETTRRHVRWRVRSVAGVAVLLLTPAVALWVVERTARRDAERAHDALRVGASCAELISVADRFANNESGRQARTACESGSPRMVALNFSRGVSLNYLIEVAITPEGTVAAVSQVGAW